MAANLTTVYNFSGGEGNSPEAGLIEGKDGNFYGTTFAPGSIFKLIPSGALATIYFTT